MVERLLFDRIDAEPRGAPVGGQYHLLAFAHAHEAGAALAVAQLAITRAQIALDAAIIQPVPVPRRMAFGHADGFIHY